MLLIKVITQCIVSKHLFKKCFFFVLDDQNGVSKKDEQDDDEGEKIEDYEVWKKRILEEAYEMLNKKV